ncbi:hypothetical protein [Celeribacter neptunius]|nr:hypothetical protein [Celeribacter neptunius]
MFYSALIASLPLTAPLAAQAQVYCEVIVYGGGAPWRFAFEEGDGLTCAKLIRNEGEQSPTCLTETTAEAPETHRYQNEDSKSFWDLRADGLMTGYVEVPTTETTGIKMVPFGGTCQEVV